MYRVFFSPSNASSFSQAATATAQAGLATVDATFTGQTSQEIYQDVTGGKPLLNDLLNQPQGSTWKEEHQETGTCAFIDGAYQVTAVAGQSMQCISNQHKLSNFVFQVDMKIVRGNFGGISFRIASDDTTYYHFGLEGNSSYLFSVEANTPYSLLADGNSPFIQTILNQTYLITIVAVGSHFYFYVNKHAITDVIDENNTLGTGQIGLTAGGGTSPATETIFTNAELWLL